MAVLTHQNSLATVIFFTLLSVVPGFPPKITHPTRPVFMQNSGRVLCVEDIGIYLLVIVLFYFFFWIKMETK